VQEAKAEDGKGADSAWETALYRRPRYVLLIIVLMIATGLATLASIPRQEDPPITNIFAHVIAQFPGADPARVDALVTERIEAELRQIPEIDNSFSSARTGVSYTIVQLKDTVPPERIELIWSEIEDAMRDAARSFPEGATEPFLDDTRTGAYTVIATLRATDPWVTQAAVGRLAEALQTRLRTIPSTRDVDLFGVPREEIAVVPDPDALTALGLTHDAVAQAIARADAKVAAGEIQGKRTGLTMEISGEIDGLARLREIPLAVSDGRSLRVGDVATIERTVADPPATLAQSNGERAVLVAARMADNRQVDSWAANVRQEIAAFEASLPSGVTVETVFDQSVYTTQRLTDVASNMILGVCLVVVVLVLSMGVRAALIVGLTIPVVTFASLTVLGQIGISVHQMSMSGLIVALGLMVDAAIVSADEVRQRMQNGARPVEAVAGTVRRLAIPLFASSLTTVLTFLPMALLPGPSGDFLGSIAISVIVMLAVSLLAALTLTPALAARFLGSSSRQPPRWWDSGISGGFFGKGFAATIRLALHWPLLAMLAAAMPAIVGFLSFPTLVAQFFPLADRDQFFIEVHLPTGSTLDSTQAAVDAVEAVLQQDSAILSAHWVIGGDAPSFYYNMLFTRESEPRFAEALVRTRSADDTAIAIPRLQAAVDAAVPEALVLMRPLKQGPGTDAPIEVLIYGEDPEALRAVGEDIRLRLSQHPDIVHSQADIMGGFPQILFRLDEDKVRLAGLSLQDVAQQIRAATNGVPGGSLVEGPEELPVMVRLPLDRRDDADDLASLNVLPPGAAPGTAGIPLSALGRFEIVPAQDTLARRGGERINTVRGYTAYGVLPEEVVTRLRAGIEADPPAMPAGFRIDWGGESDARDETIGNLVATLFLVIAASIATIVFTFNSWRLSAATAVVAILAIGLSLLALAVFQYPFSIVAVIGVIGGIGVSINAAIILLTALQDDPAAVSGDLDATQAVVLRSSRHILSTTITTFGGFLPLLLAGGGFWPPFAMAIAGGVLLSSIVSFYFVPAAFVVLMGRRAERQAAVAQGA